MKKFNRLLLLLSTGMLLAACGEQPAESSSQASSEQSSSAQTTSSAATTSEATTEATTEETTELTTEETTEDSTEETTEDTTEETSDDTSVDSSDGEEDVYAGTLGGNALSFVDATEELQPEDTALLQLKATGLTAAAGDAIAFTKNGEAIEPGASGEGNNALYNEATHALSVITAGSELTLYFKVYEDGYDIWLTGYQAPVSLDGAYLVGTFNSWTQNAASKGTEGGTDIGQWLNFSIAAGDEFKIVVKDGETETWLGFDSLGNADSKVGFHKNEEEGASNNNIVCDTAGTYNVYLNDQKKIYISNVNGGSDSSEGTPSKANGAYLVGSHNDWTQNDASKGTPEGDNKAQWLNIDLAADVQFKIVVGDGTTEEWLGYDSIGNDESKALVERKSEQGPGDNNIIVKVGASYNIYLNNQNKIYITKVA